MAFSSFGRIGWVLSDHLLIAYTSNLDKVSETILPAAGRSVRADGSRLAVAAGTHGVFILEATDPASPTVVKQFEGVRFAYGADLYRERLYVAAGPEGVVVVDASGPELSVIGVARELTFAADVVVGDDGVAWILDRDGQRVQIAEIEKETVASRSN